MSSLMTMALVRNPKPAPPLKAGTPAIVTHPREPAAATSGKPANGASLEEQLYAACQASDWPRLIAVARGHIDGLAGAGRKLHPITVAVLASIRPRQIAATDHDLSAFAAGFEAGAIKDYMAGGLLRDRAVLADEALALHCLDALGTAGSDPIGKLRSINAFSALMGRLAKGGTEPGPSLSRVVEAAYEAEVHLPGWSFEIDVCGDLHPASKVGELTPLELRWRRIEQMREGATGSCDCVPAEPVCTPQSVCCPELRYFVTDLLELRDWTYRYKAGDIAYIEVVGAGETRSRDHVMKVTKDVFSELTSVNHVLDKRDLSVTDTGNMSREINHGTTSKLDQGNTVVGSYGVKDGPYNLSVTAKLDYGKTAADSIKDIQSQVRTLVSSAVAQIEKTVTSHNTERVTTDTTETNAHAWNNTAGMEPKVTKYFWVTQEKRAQLYSHGLRLMAELIIPSPARLFEKLLSLKREAIIDREVPAPTEEEPAKPTDIPFGPDALTAANYLAHAAEYGVASPPPPPKTQEVSTTSSREKGDNSNVVLSAQLQVPQDYHAIALGLSGSVFFKGTGERYLEFWIGGSGKVERHDSGNGQAGTASVGVGPLAGSVTIDGRAKRFNSFSVTLTLALEIDAAAWAAWQQSAFKPIQDSQDERLAAYKTAHDAWDTRQAEYRAARDQLRKDLISQESAGNPFYNRQIEQTELKRAAIYLLCEDFSSASAWIAKAEPCGLPEIDRHMAALHGYDWYFWDRLFDWQYMAYAFFDYFWNPTCDWAERFDPDNADPMFKAFLGAGYARVLIPVSQSMEADFLWYATTLQKWGQTGEPPLDPTDPRWQNVLYELKYANKDAMMPRQGYLENVTPGDATFLLKDTDRYWDPGAGSVDAAAVAADLDREIFVDGSVYMIAGIQPEPGSPAYSNADTMWWRVTIDRPYEGTASARRLYACGAQAVAPAFSFDLPTELIWAGAHDDCLPTYPLPPCVH